MTEKEFELLKINTRSQVSCWFFLSGYCRYGDECHYYHDSAPPSRGTGPELNGNIHKDEYSFEEVGLISSKLKSETNTGILTLTKVSPH